MKKTNVDNLHLDRLVCYRFVKKNIRKIVDSMNVG